jgi:hypothetical protein
MSNELSPSQIVLGVLASLGVGGGALAGMTIAGGMYSGASSPAPPTAVPRMIRQTQSPAALAAQSAARIPTALGSVHPPAPRRPARHHRATPSVEAVVPAVAAPVTPRSRVHPIAQASQGVTSVTRVTSAPVRRAPAATSAPPRSNPVISAPAAPRPAPAAAPAPVRDPAPAPKPKANPKPQAIGAFDDSG